MVAAKVLNGRKLPCIYHTMLDGDFLVSVILWFSDVFSGMIKMG